MRIVGTTGGQVISVPLIKEETVGRADALGCDQYEGNMATGVFIFTERPIQMAEHVILHFEDEPSTRYL